MAVTQIMEGNGTEWHEFERNDRGKIQNIDSGTLGSCIRRELSFSSWCDEDEPVYLNQALGVVEAIEEDSGFELPFLKKNELQDKPLDR